MRTTSCIQESSGRNTNSDTSLSTFPGNPTPLLKAFKDAKTLTSESGATRGYLLLDFHPTSRDALRLLTGVFDERPTAYVPREYIKGARSDDDHEPRGSR